MDDGCKAPIQDEHLDEIHGRLLTPLYGGFTTDVSRLVAEVRRLRALLTAPPSEDEWRAYEQAPDDGKRLSRLAAAFAIRARKIGDSTKPLTEQANDPAFWEQNLPLPSEQMRAAERGDTDE